LHQPGCLSAESKQYGFMQRFEQHNCQHMLQKHLTTTTMLQSCCVDDKLCMSVKRPKSGPGSEVKFSKTDETSMMQYDLTWLQEAARAKLIGS